MPLDRLLREINSSEITKSLLKVTPIYLTFNGVTVRPENLKAIGDMIDAVKELAALKGRHLSRYTEPKAKITNELTAETEHRLYAIYSDEDQARIDEINNKMFNYNHDLFNRIDELPISDRNKKIKYNNDRTRITLLDQYRELISTMVPVGHSRSTKYSG